MSSIFEDPETGNRLITSRNGIEPRNKYLMEENSTLRVRGQNTKMILHGHLSEAFGRVPRELLWEVMKKFGYPPKFIQGLR